MRNSSPIKSAGQRGIVILTLMLVVLSASSFVVLKALNANTMRRAQVDLTTKQALMEAKSALMGYAIGWHVADPGNPPALGKGPGHLPCPDHDAAGTPGSSDTVPSCTLASSNETGRFPWRTLGIHELLDGSGSPLWYAVSDNHRVTADPPLNSDSAGTLQVDAATDVVAVIIAPGAGLAGQYRDTSNEYDAADFLEDGNVTVGDNAFVSIASGEFNDVIVHITRGELMAAVERTVLNEVANALDNYFDDPDADDDTVGDDPDCGADTDCDDGYPWLSDFADPSASNYVGVIDDFGGGDVAFGHLPLVRWDQPVTSNADFTADWSIATGGTFTPTGTEPPAESSVRGTTDTENFEVFPGFPPSSVPHAFPANIAGALGAPWSQGTCQLSKETISSVVYQVVNCVATYDFSVSWFIFTRDLRRVYTLELKNNLRVLAAPNTTARRTFSMQETDSWSGAESTITVTDYWMPFVFEIGSAVFTFDTMSTGDDINIAAVPFDLEISDDTTVDHNTSPGELPNWFVANNWHQHVLVQYAEAESPGDVDLTCVDDTSCLTLNITRPDAGTPVTDTTVRGVVVAAGSDLAGNRPTATLADYLEGNNATVDVIFDKQQVTTVFNDQVVTIPLQRP